MFRITTAVFLALLLAGCADGKFVRIDEPNTCGTTGWTVTAIHYGDSRIVVIPVSEVVRDAEFRFVLVPASESTDTVDYQDVMVKVKGKPPHDTWFDEAAGNASDGDGTIRVCVDGASLVPGDEIAYLVEVDGVGVLDPRATVIIRPGLD